MGTGQVGCQTFPPPARGGGMLPQVVLGLLSSRANSPKSTLETQTVWKNLMLQISPGTGKGRTSAVTERAQGHLLTLLDVWIYTNLREAESFKGYVPGVYREEKKYIFPSCRFSVHTLTRRTMCNFLALPYVFPKRIQSGSHMNGDTDEFLPSNINKSEQFF